MASTGALNQIYPNTHEGSEVTCARFTRLGAVPGVGKTRTYGIQEHALKAQALE